MKKVNYRIFTASEYSLQFKELKFMKFPLHNHLRGQDLKTVFRKIH